MVRDILFEITINIMYIYENWSNCLSFSILFLPSLHLIMNLYLNPTRSTRSTFFQQNQAEWRISGPNIPILSSNKKI